MAGKTTLDDRNGPIRFCETTSPILTKNYLQFPGVESIYKPTRFYPPLHPISTSESRSPDVYRQ